MTGKGWFVVYGLLLLVMIYLGVTQFTLGKQVAALQRDVTRLKASPSPKPKPIESPSQAPAAAQDGGSADTRDAIRKADLASLRAAALAFRRDHKAAPPDLKQLAPKYLSELPADPLDPKYTYRYGKNGAQTFVLTGVLETPNDPEDALDKDHKKDGIYTLTDK